MDSSLSILGVIAFVVFHLAVTLPLAALTTRHLVWPWLGAQGLQKDLPEWAATVALFAVMAAAFALRAHVIGARAAHPAHPAHPSHHPAHPAHPAHPYQHMG